MQVFFSNVSLNSIYFMVFFVKAHCPAIWCRQVLAKYNSVDLLFSLSSLTCPQIVSSLPQRWFQNDSYLPRDRPKECLTIINFSENGTTSPCEKVSKCFIDMINIAWKFFKAGIINSTRENYQSPPLVM